MCTDPSLRTEITKLKSVSTMHPKYLQSEPVPDRTKTHFQPMKTRMIVHNIWTIFNSHTNPTL
jgi:hypothetical protein